MATISVVIPSYNQAEYLSDAIESAYGQTYPPHEIIVVDDGSTDASLAIAERYKYSKYPLIESPVRVIKQVNKGLATARNTGIMNATGDYILFLDADDILLEEALEVINMEIMATNGDVIAPSFKEFGKRNREVILQGFTMDDLKEANRLGYFSAVRRSALLEVGGYNHRMKHGYEDYDLWFDLFKRGKSFSLIQKVLVLYRVKEKSMIHDAQAHHEELMAQIRINHPELWPK
jgi:glycosyltransferase involved in cell wall biosynthesis